MAPTIEGGAAIHMRGIVTIDAAAAECGGVVDPDAFGDDKADTRFGATAIIGSDFVSWNTMRGIAPCHRCHDNAVCEFQVTQAEGSKQGGKARVHRTGSLAESVVA